MGIKADYEKNARELARVDVGKSSWSDDLKATVRKASKSDMGILVPAYAVLQSARQEQLAKLESSYKQANQVLSDGDYKRAKKLFKALGNYSDSQEKAQHAARKEEQRIKEEEELRLKNEKAYKRAQDLSSQKKYDQARKAYLELGSFRDASYKASELQAKENRYNAARSKYEAGKYAQAEQEFATLFDYKESKSFAEKARKERLRDSELERAKKLEGTVAELQQEKAKYCGYKYQLLEAKRLSEKSSSFLYEFAKITAIFWVPLIAGSLFFLYARGDAAGQAERYPILMISLAAGLAGLAALIIGFFIEQHMQSNQIKANNIRKNMPRSITYHGAVKNYAPWSSRGYNSITIEEIDKYLDVLRNKIDELSNDASCIYTTYSKGESTPPLEATSLQENTAVLSAATLSGITNEATEQPSSRKPIVITLVIVFIIAVLAIALAANATSTKPSASRTANNYEITEVVPLDIVFSNPSVDGEGRFTIDSITNNTNHTIGQLSFLIFAWDANGNPVVRTTNKWNGFASCNAMRSDDNAIMPGESRDMRSVYWQFDKVLTSRIARITVVAYTMQDTSGVGYENSELRQMP